MAMTVNVTESAKKDISSLPAKVQARVAAKLVELANYPHVSNLKALTGPLKGKIRARVGGYRIFFTVKDGVVTVVQVDDRKDAY